MTPEEEKKIAKWNTTLSEDVTIRFILTEDKRSRLLADFCDRFQRIASKVAFLKEEDDENGLPAIKISQRFRYHAVPLGRELTPFLEAVKHYHITSSEKASSRSIYKDFQAVRIPAFLQVFIAPQCPHCPQVVQQLMLLPDASASIDLAVIDGTLFPETTQAYRIQSVPTLLLDGQFRWTGSVPLVEVAQIMAHRDPASLGVSSLEGMLKEGAASAVVEMMMEAKQIFPAFVDLLVHEKMFVRLGAMVVMEELSERDPVLARQAVEPLWLRFDQVNEQIQGDIIHVIGETGDQRSVFRMKEVLNSPAGQEVRDAARDALTGLLKAGL